MTYSGQLSNILDEAKAKLSDLVRLHGEESKFKNCKVIKIDSYLDRTELENGRYLSEVSQNELIDDYGYEYSANVLEVTQFLSLVDYFVKKFETKKN